MSPDSDDDRETLLRRSQTDASLAGTEQREFRNSEDPTAITALRGSDAEPRVIEELRAGSCLRGRYVLESVIGQGAMGRVWRAKDLLAEKAHEKKPFVAIKVLTSDFEGDPKSFIAMHREASRTQKLGHPNIVRLHTLDRDDRTSRVFIVMELLDGTPLDKFIRSGSGRSSKPQELLSIVVGMAEGLAYAHRKGIVHSDFKPGNVFLSHDGTPKVLDFGIARASKEGDTATSSNVVDDDSVVSGYTEGYASPEMFAYATPHPADDVFALGIVVYELLTGEHPFDRRPANEAQLAGKRPAQVKSLSRRHWRVLDKALAFKREDRWQSAGAFVRAIQRNTALRTALVVAVSALVLTAGGLSYQNYLDRQPAVALERLPTEQQSKVRQALAAGDEAMRAVRESRLIEASADAADSYAEAYAMHPRNPQATAGLQAAASAFIEWWRDQSDRARAVQELRKFQQKSEYYRGYKPLMREIDRLESLEQ